MSQSTSWITNKSYQIPEHLSDRKNIDDFIRMNDGKKIVVVQGLGFVGAVMSLVVANAVSEEYAVIGIDLPGESSFWKIQSINEGIFPIVSSDKKIAEFFSNALRNNNLYATFDPFAYSLADIIIVDINLDVQKIVGEHKSLIDFSVDLKPFTSAIRIIAENCKEDVLVLVETTVPPGTCEKIVKPLFDEVFKSRNLSKNFKIGHSYERVMPGPGYIDSIQNFYRVYAGIDDDSANETELFLRTIIFTDKFPLTRLHSTTASEMSKVLENSFRAANIAFVQEWSCFAEEAGVNIYQVLNAIRMRPTHKNIMSPGLGVGGYCLPKDPLMASWSRQNLINGKEPLAQSVAAVRINDQMSIHTFNSIRKKYNKKLEGRTIGLLGISYLSNVGDTRYTPAELLYELLVEAGASVIVNDEYVPVWNEKNLQTLSLHEFIIREPEIIIYCANHDYFKTDERLNRYLLSQANLLIVDAIGALDDERVEKFQKNNSLLIIGRGDI